MAARKEKSEVDPAFVEVKRDPALLEVSIQASIGGKVAILEFGKLTSDYGTSRSERWSVEGLSAEEADALVETRRDAIVEDIEAHAQKELNWRTKWRNEAMEQAGE